MAKKAPKDQALAVVEPKTDDVVGFEITPDVEAFAHRLGVDIHGSVDERADRAADHMSRSQMHMLGSGLLLLSIKSEAEHGEFTRIVTERGFEERSAQRAMSYAQFVLSRPEGERDLLLDMPRYKVLTLAQADPEVVDQLLKDGGGALSALSIKAMAARIKELEARETDLGVQLEISQNEVKAAKKAASKDKDRTGDIPEVMFDLRQEMGALIEKASLSLQSMHGVGVDLAVQRGQEGCHDWVGPSARLAVSGLLGLRMSIDGLVQQYVAGFDLEQVQPEPLSYLLPEEVELSARKYADLIALHQHEKQLREWHRKQERPRGKGRPEAKPEAPKTSTV